MKNFLAIFNNSGIYAGINKGTEFLDYSPITKRSEVGKAAKIFYIYITGVNASVNNKFISHYKFI